VFSAWCVPKIYKRDMENRFEQLSSTEYSHGKLVVEEELEVGL
jgi:hypothetical protein